MEKVLSEDSGNGFIRVVLKNLGQSSLREIFQKDTLTKLLGRYCSA